MMPPAKTEPLPETLARRIQVLRDRLDLTPAALARKAAMSLEHLEEIEGGLVPFLSAALRQKLARALRVKSAVLREVEKPPAPADSGPAAVSADARDDLLAAVLARPDRTYFCPACGKKLTVRSFDRCDLEDRAVTAVKIACTACLFRLNLD